MRKYLVAAIIAAGAVSCGASQDSTDSAVTPAAAQSKSAAAETFDQTTEQREAWETTRDSYTAAIKLDICGAAKKGGAKAVRAYLVSDEMPFEVEDPAYDAGQWVKYCH